MTVTRGKCVKHNLLINTITHRYGASHACEESNGLTYRLGQLSLAECPPIATIVGTVQPNVRPGGGAQDGTVRAQGQGLDPPWALVVVDGLSTCLCAP